MRVYLGLERHDIRIPQGQLLQINLFKLILQLIRHAVERIVQIQKFSACFFLFNFYPEMPLFDFRSHVNQPLYRRGNLPVQEIKYNEYKRKGERHHQDGDIPDGLLLIMDGVVVHLHHITDNMIVHFPFTGHIGHFIFFMVYTVSFRILPADKILRPTGAEHPLIIYADIIIQIPGNSLHALKDAVLVDIHDNYRIGRVYRGHNITHHI